MATYTGTQPGLLTADAEAWSPPTGITYTGAAAEAARAGGDLVFGGSTARAAVAGVAQSFAPEWSGRILATAAQDWKTAAVEPWLVEWTGRRYGAAAFQVSAVYRKGDKLTVAGYARDRSGQPLRSVQLHFIGLTVQDHFFGSATNLDGIYTAYLDVGDSYTAFAFHPTTGITFALEEWQDSPTTTTLVFRQVTKRGGFGEGIFLQGGA